MFKKIYEWIRALFTKLHALKDTPHSIAGGIAIGMFMGFSPLVGLKTAVAMGLAYLFRCNVIAAAISVSLHDVFIPLLPFLLRVEYQIGYWLLSNPHHLPPKFDYHQSHLKLADMFKWTTFLSTGRQLLVGSLFLSAPAALISYYVSLVILKRRKPHSTDLAD
ncbi:N/A [soil metagenome]